MEIIMSMLWEHHLARLPTRWHYPTLRKQNLYKFYNVGRPFKLPSHALIASIPHANKPPSIPCLCSVTCFNIACCTPSSPPRFKAVFALIIRNLPFWVWLSGTLAYIAWQCVEVSVASVHYDHICRTHLHRLPSLHHLSTNPLDLKGDTYAIFFWLYIHKSQEVSLQSKLF